MKVEKVDDVYRIIIDKDVVRPEGGGQAGDRGSLDDAKILNTVQHDDITYLETDSSLEEGKRAVLRVDMKWRRGSMRNHTAEHLFVSQLRKQDKDLKLGYIWIDADQGTVDIEGSLDTIMIFEAESRVQRIILDDLPVCTSMMDAQSLPPSVRAREGLDSKYDMLRIVTIEGVDDSACSGIHVLSTGDIGFFKITDFKRDAEKTRIQFFTHLKAAHHTQDVYNDVLSRKATYPFEMEQIGSVLDKAKKIQSERTEMIELVSKLLSKTNEYLEIKDTKFYHYYLPGFEAKDLRNILKDIEFEKNSCILLFAPGEKSSFIFWTFDMPRNAGYYSKETTENLGGKGGGSRESFTGGFSGVEDSHELYNLLVQGISKTLSES